MLYHSLSRNPQCTPCHHPCAVVGAIAAGAYVVDTDWGPESVFAAKVVPLVERQDMLKHEAAVFSEMGAEDGFVRYLDNIIDGSNMWIIQDLCVSTLYMRLSEPGAPPMTDAECNYAMHTTALALAKMHEGSRLTGHTFVHRDVRPHNVFVRADGKVVLGDFGMSRPSVPLDAARSIAHTLTEWQTYVPVELTHDAGPLTYSTKTDVWMLGQLFFFLLTRRCPFIPASSECAAFSSVGERAHEDAMKRRAPISFTEEDIARIPLPMLLLLVWMLDYDQSARPDMRGVLNHPAFWPAAHCIAASIALKEGWPLPADGTTPAHLALMTVAPEWTSLAGEMPFLGRGLLDCGVPAADAARLYDASVKMTYLNRTPERYAVEWQAYLPKSLRMTRPGVASQNVVDVSKNDFQLAGLSAAAAAATRADNCVPPLRVHGVGVFRRFRSLLAATMVLRHLLTHHREVAGHVTTLGHRLEELLHDETLGSSAWASVTEMASRHSALAWVLPLLYRYTVVRSQLDARAGVASDTQKLLESVFPAAAPQAVPKVRISALHLAEFLGLRPMSADDEGVLIRHRVPEEHAFRRIAPSLPLSFPATIALAVLLPLAPSAFGFGGAVRVGDGAGPFQWCARVVACVYRAELPRMPPSSSAAAREERSFRFLATFNDNVPRFVLHRRAFLGAVATQLHVRFSLLQAGGGLVESIAASAVGVAGAPELPGGAPELPSGASADFTIVCTTDVHRCPAPDVLVPQATVTALLALVDQFAHKLPRASAARSGSVLTSAGAAGGAAGGAAASAAAAGGAGGGGVSRLPT